MLDWLKFFPYARAREDAPKPTEIRGPYFAKLRKKQWRLGDCVLHFEAPWSNPIFRLGDWNTTVNSLSPGRSNILKKELERVYSSGGGPPSLWKVDLFYSNTWYFVGQWFSGQQASLGADGLLVSAKSSSSFSENNLFHPRVFESAVANYLDNVCGYKRSGKRPDYRGPLNWRIQRLSLSIQAAVFDLHYIANGGKNNPDLRRRVCFPISPHQFIMLTFDFGGVEIYHDEMRTKPLMQLCDSIINSLRLEVGDVTQAEWDKVKATCPDMSLSDTFGELPWPLIEEKPGKKPKEVDITPNNEPTAVQFKP